MVCSVRSKIKLAIEIARTCITTVGRYVYPVPELRRLIMKVVEIREVIMEIQPKIQGVTCRALRGFDGSKDNFFWAHLDTHGFIKRLDFLVA